MLRVYYVTSLSVKFQYVYTYVVHVVLLNVTYRDSSTREDIFCALRVPCFLFLSPLLSPHCPIRRCDDKAKASGFPLPLDPPFSLPPFFLVLSLSNTLGCVCTVMLHQGGVESAHADTHSKPSFVVAVDASTRTLWFVTWTAKMIDAAEAGERGVCECVRKREMGVNGNNQARFPRYTGR